MPAAFTLSTISRKKYASISFCEISLSIAGSRGGGTGLPGRGEDGEGVSEALELTAEGLLVAEDLLAEWNTHLGDTGLVEALVFQEQSSTHSEDIPGTRCS